VSVPEKVYLQSLGGTSSHWANTTEDITHYYYTIPQNALETALWLESDRMAVPLTRADAAHLGPVREVIKQERLQGHENPVFGLADELTLAALFPEGHPYRTGPLGPMADLNATTAADAVRFCGPYYVPNNAIVSLSGDITPARARTLIERYFGGIPRGQTVARRAIPERTPPLPARLVLEDARARAPVLRFAWPSVGFADPDRLPLVALAALLSRDRTGALSKVLVYERALATRVVAANYDFERGGLFQIEVFPKAGASLTSVEQIVDSALASFNDRQIRAEDLESFKRSNAVMSVTLLQTRAARADTLAQGEMFAHDPIAYAKQVHQTFALTPADLQRVARRYLSSAHVVMSMIPAKVAP
jgi:zinc protease